MLLLGDVALAANSDEISLFLVFGFFLPNRHLRSQGSAQEDIEYENRTQTTHKAKKRRYNITFMYTLGNVLYSRPASTKF